MVERSHLSPYLYHVVVEVDPVRGKEYLKWLSSKHIQEVITHPGFMWARRVSLDEPAEDGWKRFMIVYGINSRDDFLTYRESDLFRGFQKELKQFEEVYRIIRYFGPVDLVLD